MIKEDVIKKIELLLRSRKEFQKWALPTYVRNYYSYDKILFDKLKHPPKVKKSVNLDTLLNFDAHYCLFEEDELKKGWKLNFLVANICVINALKQILKDLKDNSKNVQPKNIDKANLPKQILDKAKSQAGLEVEDGSS